MAVQYYQYYTIRWSFMEYIILSFSLLSNRPVGPWVGIARTVVSLAGLNLYGEGTDGISSN